HRGDAAVARVVVAAERDLHTVLNHLADRRQVAALEGGGGADHGGHPVTGHDRDVLFGHVVQPVGGGAAELGGELDGAAAAEDAGVDARQQAHVAARGEHPAGLLGGEVALVAVDVDAV